VYYYENANDNNKEKITTKEDVVLPFFCTSQSKVLFAPVFSAASDSNKKVGVSGNNNNMLLWYTAAG